MSAPALSLDVAKLHDQFPRRFSLDVLHDLAGRQSGWTRQQNVYVIARNRSLKDFNLVRAAYLADQCSKADANLARQDRFSIFRHPDEVILDRIASVGTGAIVFHPTSLQKSVTGNPPVSWAE